MKEKCCWWVLESKNLDNFVRRDFLNEKVKAKFPGYKVNVFVDCDFLNCSSSVKAYAEFSAEIVGKKILIVLNWKYFLIYF